MNLWDVLKRQFTFNFFFLWLVFSALYICLSIYLLNYSLVFTTLFSSTPISYKVTILWSLLEGLFTAFSPTDSYLIIFIAVLVGLNITLMIQTIRLIKQSKKVQLSLGGGTVLGIIASGCGTCGFSILSLFGLSASLVFLPFHGTELYILTIILLVCSLLYMTIQLKNYYLCKR